MDESLIKNKVSSISTRNEKIAWNRKMVKMEKLIAKLLPIEERILEIIKEEKYPLMDEIEKVRKTMVSECIHPKEYLIIDPDCTHAHCKFCGKNIRWQ